MPRDCCCECCNDCCGCDCCVPDHGPFPCAPIPLTVFLGNFSFPITVPVQLSVPPFGAVGPAITAVDAAALVAALNAIVIPALIALGFTVIGVYSLDPTGTLISVPLIGKPPAASGCAQMLVPVR